jgi:prepilin-type N-terminal cleavage/methylation domain-containing protein
MRGFTLIELLISAAIISVITSIVLVRFNVFDGTVLIKSLAYEVGATIREAQIYSVSVVNVGVDSDAGFRYPYGLSFTAGSTGYEFFRYNDTDPAAIPQYEPSDVFPVRTLALANSMEVAAVCITNSGSDNCNISRLDISFRRPEFSAIFYAPPIGNASTISAAKVYLRSTRSPGNVWIVETKLLGQISVYRCTTGTVVNTLSDSFTCS